MNRTISVLAICLGLGATASVSAANTPVRQSANEATVGVAENETANSDIGDVCVQWASPESVNADPPKVALLERLTPTYAPFPVQPINEPFSMMR